MRLTATQKILLATLLPTPPNQRFVRAWLPAQNHQLDWAKIVSKALSFQTSSLLRCHLAAADLLHLLPHPERDLLEKVNHAEAAKHLIYVNEVQNLIAALRTENIRALPLKGAALMIGAYYPTPGLRSAIDIDLLIEPEKIQQSFALAHQAGFTEVKIKPSRAPLPLPHELRHLPLLRGPSGVLLELHFRAFHDLRRQQDFGFEQMIGRAVTHNNLLLPAPEDLCLHLIQHAIVDLTSAHAILRTFADLYFVLQREPQSREKLLARAAEFELGGAVRLALETLQVIKAGSYEHSTHQVSLLLETAVAESPGRIIRASRLFEYLDLRQQPLARLRHLFSLLSAAKNQNSSQSESSQRLKQAFGLLRKFEWKGLTIRDLRRVMALRKITLRK